MDKNNLELQVLQLSELQNICNQILELENPKQNDEFLLKLLTKEYSLTTEDITYIKSIVFGKKKGEKFSKKEIEFLKKKFESYCLITDINPLDKKNNEFIGYKKIKQRASNKKNSLNDKLKEI